MVKIGYSSRCKVCNSAYRTEIEQWNREGMSSRQVAKKLELEHGERISYRAIQRHMVEHFDVQAAAREQYERSKELMENETAKVLSEIEMIERTIRRNYEVFCLVSDLLLEMLHSKADKIPHSLVQLSKVSSEELRQHIKQKQELLGDSNENEEKKPDFIDILTAAWEQIDNEEEKAVVHQ